ncbi:hypothetical protein [Gluconobacter sp. P5H9_d]|uniref:hypothetical protein n=1 Tax=Gluconobacter sp. P5H9_d TaxID=2762615 RepID=UPI001C04ECFB|nr:hypothetical protein [Gluconobacter sp. P5H9_d]
MTSFKHGNISPQRVVHLKRTLATCDAPYQSSAKPFEHSPVNEIVASALTCDINVP